MKLVRRLPPRSFEVGAGKKITISDCGRVELETDEQVTFRTASGAEYDVARKAWGFYATPSLNGRLESFNLRAVLVRNQQKKYYVLLVEKGEEPSFEKYLSAEKMSVVHWLDSDKAFAELEAKLK